MISKPLSAFILLAFIQFQAVGQSGNLPSRQDTLKGSITRNRDWWDIKYYSVSIKPDYNSKTIRGKNSITFNVILSNKNRLMQIDLQDPLRIDSVLLKGEKIDFEKDGSAWFLKVPQLKSKSKTTIDIFYSGKPKESLDPPWDGGISWSQDSLKRPWITLGAQLVGASVWYPCKVHQSDEPVNGASIAINVPNTLVAIGNGRLTEKLKHADSTVTYKWQVSNPINNYGLAFYVGNYVQIPETYKGEKGILTTDYWVIDYHKERVQSYLKQEVDKTLKTFEYWFGAYPFYKDSFKMVETPYPGMEHQSAVAYGNGFKLGRVKLKNLSYWDLKTDRLVVHEIAHEWFGNSITTKDFTDRWLHEGFAGFAEELFIESQYGKKAGKEFFEARTLGRIKNNEPLIRRYNIFEDAGGHMYLKGWTLIHMLRALMDDDVSFRKMLRGINQEFYHQTVNSIDVEKYISRHYRTNIQRVFNQYLREKALPVFEYQITGDTLKYRYSNCLVGFNMPIKTSFTKENWLYPTTQWKEMHLAGPITTPLKIDSNYYVDVKYIQ